MFIAASFDSILSRSTLGSLHRALRLAFVPISAVLYFLIVRRAFLSLSIAIEVGVRVFPVCGLCFLMDVWNVSWYIFTIQSHVCPHSSDASLSFLKFDLSRFKIRSRICSSSSLYGWLCLIILLTRLATSCVAEGRPMLGGLCMWFL